MILLSELLDEDGEAAQQAKQMGLISKGWGRWADPRTGKVTHKTDGGRLVAVDPTTDTGPSDDDHEGWQDSPDGRSTTYKQKTKASRDAATAGKEPDLDRVAKDLGDKPKSKYDDPKYKKGDWWDDPDFDQKMMARRDAERDADTSKIDPDRMDPSGKSKYGGRGIERTGKAINTKRPSDMSTGNPKYDKFLNAVEDRVKNLDVNIGDTYSPEEFAKKSGISPDQQKAYHKLYRSTETWEVPAFELIPGKDGKTSVFIPDPQDV